MKVSVLQQYSLGTGGSQRFGDAALALLYEDWCHRFHFATAYMRTSGLARLAPGLDSLLDRGGAVRGAVGIDGVTSREALETLMGYSAESTVVHTVSGFIFHPKAYMGTGDDRAVAVVGSANLTRDGLFRNLEFGLEIEMDLSNEGDAALFNDLDGAIGSLLDPSYPNVRRLNHEILERLTEAGALESEGTSREPGPKTTAERGPADTAIADLFPPLFVPAPPPVATPEAKPTGVPAASPPHAALTFIMELSGWDSSHQSGVPGTAEILVPKAALPFFPTISAGGRKYDDAYFDVMLHGPSGPAVKEYRLWHYPVRDEHRLRIDNATIEMIEVGGGSLMVISRLPDGNDPPYEASILQSSDPQYPAFRARCKPDPQAQGKLWAFV